MGIRSVKYVLALACSLWIVAGSAAAQDAPEPLRAGFLPIRGAGHGTPVRQSIPLKAALLTYHGGPTITSAKVVLIFWGPTFSNPGSADFSYAQTLISFRNQYGTTPEYQTITEYSGIQLSNLGSGTVDWFDTSAPPANVTDTAVRGEVNLYLASHTFDANTIYEVVLPSTSYSSNGTSTSCGGPALAYCAYHSWIGSGTSATKYSVQPYPSCTGCQVAGWTAVQNQEHFITHETREAVTDPTGLGWTDANNFEADDECAWSPPPFLVGGYGYQFEWSNAANKCISFPGAGAPPAVPTLTITNEACNGLNTADWTASSGATAYELWGSSTSTFTFSSLFYSGPNTTKLVNVGGTTYFHVRACNANGCSAFSNTGIGRHVNGCL
ncbi:MAG TPA: hypothetical protein VF173_10210 [Thermoanaerobaculia bacterium]|nr:hypothetical protein [Thermoanaerobaculia bacterium]